MAYAFINHVCPLAPMLPVFGPSKKLAVLFRTTFEARNVVALLDATLTASVPVVAGSVRTLLPETAGACSVMVPLVSPAMTL